MEWIKKGVCSPIGFKANGVHAGIRKNKEKKDLALIVSDCLCSAASLYTTNLVKGAPILVTKKNLSNGKAQAIICNSGNANTCNDNGIEIAYGMCELVETYTGIKKNDIIIASTGVIGQKLSLDPIKNNMQNLANGLNYEGSDFAAQSIMTTDTKKKELAVKFFIEGKECKIGAIAKGSGMIAPNMATLLCFITTDTAITSKMLKKALKDNTEDTLNMLSVDGDTSTNDMVSILANGKAGNILISSENENYKVFSNALKEVLAEISKQLAADGEGATKLLTVNVGGAKNKKCAKIIAKSVVNSSLVKTAIFGADANWGRILCAIGYSGAKVDISKIDVCFKSDSGNILNVCKNGSGIYFSEEMAKVMLSEKEINIFIELNSGNEKAIAYGCDLTYDYVKINGDYRT